MSVDVITQELIRARLDGIVREMQAAVLRTGFSTIIRESHDFSAGITDTFGAVVGQYSPLPTHLGAYPDCVQGLLEFYSMDEMQGRRLLPGEPPLPLRLSPPQRHGGGAAGVPRRQGHRVLRQHGPQGRYRRTIARLTQYHRSRRVRRRPPDHAGALPARRCDDQGSGPVPPGQ